MIEEQIAKLGDRFRGLWRTYEIAVMGDEVVSKYWSVTFIYKGHYVETPEMGTPEEALEFALFKVENEERRGKEPNGAEVQPTDSD